MRRRVELLLLPALIFLVNALILGRLFSVEYLSYLESNEGTFIALTRHIAEKPWDLGWWPVWECGLPFVNTYLPGLPLLAGWFARWTGTSPALSFHQVSMLLFSCGPVLLYFLLRSMTGRVGVAFFAAFAYSVLSPCAWLSPMIRADLFDPFRLRRVQNLVYYGEAPLTATMAVFPLALWMLHLALERKRPHWWILAGAAMGVTVLFNAFGAVLLGLAAVCWISTVSREQLRSALLGIGTAAVGAYAWISPLMPPSVIQAIRANSPTVDGDFRFTSRSAMGVAILAVGFAVLWFAMRRVPSRALRFFALFALMSSGIVLLGAEAKVYVFPQPHRYQLAMDLGLCVALVLAAAEILKNRVGLRTAAVLAFVFLVWAARHNVRYGRDLIRPRDMVVTAPFRIAKWADQKLNGERILIFGSHMFQFNDFTDTPQMFGGHKPFVTNIFLRTVEYAMQSGENAGEKDGEISVLWLKALGASAVLVPGPESSAHYKLPNPRKFDGLLPVLWQENGDTIFGVPARSRSLAHVVPEASLVRHEPIHGLDVGEVRKYVEALSDASLPEATWRWLGSSAASIHAALRPGLTIVVQVNDHPGWRATANGKPVSISHDGLGLMVLKPDCTDCQIDLRFDGGTEASLARVASGLSVLASACALGWSIRRRT
jgi:hypothetical protein